MQRSLYRVVPNAVKPVFEFWTLSKLHNRNVPPQPVLVTMNLLMLLFVELHLDCIFELPTLDEENPKMKEHVLCLIQNDLKLSELLDFWPTSMTNIFFFISVMFFFFSPKKWPDACFFSIYSSLKLWPLNFGKNCNYETNLCENTYIFLIAI